MLAFQMNATLHGTADIPNQSRIIYGYIPYPWPLSQICDSEQSKNHFLRHIGIHMIERPIKVCFPLL